MVILAPFASAQEQRPVPHKDLLERVRDFDGKEILIAGQIVGGDEVSLMYLSRADTGHANQDGMLIVFSPNLAKKPGAVNGG